MPGFNHVSIVDVNDDQRPYTPALQLRQLPLDQGDGPLERPAVRLVPGRQGLGNGVRGDQSTAPRDADMLPYIYQGGSISDGLPRRTKASPFNERCVPPLGGMGKGRPENRGKMKRVSTTPV